MMIRIAVIMAGGSGERFWPLSRKRKPKQLLNLASDISMIEESLNRISPLIDFWNVYIITSELLLEPLRLALPMLPPENIVAEPCKRNTAPCLALSAAFIKSKYKEFKSEEIAIAVLTADQSIYPKEGFIKTIDSALQYIENNPVLCTIGIPPDRPETGYGYVEVQNTFDYNSNESEISPVIAFHEKPDLKTAKTYLKAGNFLWNSGMFYWRLDTFINSMQLAIPEIGNHIDKMSEKYRNKTKIPLPEALEQIRPIYNAFPNVSIDYGLMEKANNVVAAKALFKWDDIGSWDSLERIKKVDAENNIISGNTALIDVKNSVIINASKKKDMIVAGLGIDSFIVVATDDAILVIPKDRVQEVKQIVEKIKNDNGEQWL